MYFLAKEQASFSPLNEDGLSTLNSFSIHSRGLEAREGLDSNSGYDPDSMGLGKSLNTRGSSFSHSQSGGRVQIHFYFPLTASKFYDSVSVNF